MAVAAAATAAPVTIKSLSDCIKFLQAASSNVNQLTQPAVAVNPSWQLQTAQAIQDQLQAVIQYLNSQVVTQAAKKKVAVHHVLGNLVGEMLLHQMKDGDYYASEDERVGDEIDSGDDEGEEE